ncbi:MAG: GatB/YqeY domain-containing protein [Betaproteobacteria bacterium]|nr:GatB/YqeY domain-containing protein [Betaproteobacteria bacterium]MBU6512042.1 GatB/YqeY domain-containing protein [Betaproteobacteria bacterium]MDE1954801.1 GatB/YqeY domain-containing protein [Betaproteobacteria bacterium]MDE2152231.1 GatB/YqeY domain-containing protein [Betaproteobacteria bacterium]
MSQLKTRIQDDMKAAMRAKDTARLGTVRMLLAAVKQREVDERIELDDAAVLAVIERMIKQRRDAITQFEAGGRADLAAAETAEIGVLEPYLPARLGGEELDAEIRAAIAELGLGAPQDLGKLMPVLKPRLAGRADMAQVSARAKALLSGQ